MPSINPEPIGQHRLRTELWHGGRGQRFRGRIIGLACPPWPQVPIFQGIAVTGSVSQKGEIQPIGGVNEKIEGFFESAGKKALPGNKGS